MLSMVEANKLLNSLIDWMLAGVRSGPNNGQGSILLDIVGPVPTIIRASCPKAFKPEIF